MRTHVRLPKFVDKYITVVSFATVIVGFVAIAVINGLQHSDIFDAQAGMMWNGGEYTNVCGSGTDATFYNCPANCSMGSGSCSPNSVGVWSVVYTCDGYHTACTENERQGWAFDTSANTCNKTQQIDVFSKDCRAGGGWNCGDGDLQGYMVWWHPCEDTTNPTSNPTTTTSSIQDVCPHNSTQARVRENGSADWVRELTLIEGESFQISSFHNGTFNNYARNTRIRVKGPNDFSFACNANQNDCNEHTITNVAIGTYTVTVLTKKSGGGTYSEPECRGTASVFVDDAESDFSITKTVDNNDHSYEPGDAVFFNIRIENTGEETIEQLEFIDRYDPRYLDFVSIQSSGTDLTEHVRIVNVSGSSREVIIDDLTAYLGDLSIGEHYSLTIRFVARAVDGSVRTVNYAIADDGDDRREDDDYIDIEPIDVPPTDR